MAEALEFTRALPDDAPLVGQMCLGREMAMWILPVANAIALVLGVIMVAGILNRKPAVYITALVLITACGFAADYLYKTHLIEYAAQVMAK